MAWLEGFWGKHPKNERWNWIAKSSGLGQEETRTWWHICIQSVLFFGNALFLLSFSENTLPRALRLLEHVFPSCKLLLASGDLSLLI